MDGPDKPESAPPAAGVEGGDDGRATILVVDDDPSVRTFLRKVLGRAGHRVLEADDGEGALRIWKESGAVDLVITDMVMPRMGGRALLHELFKDDPTLPVIYISGDPAEVSVQRAGAPGTVGYLQKPFRTEDIHALVDQLLGRA